MPQHLSNDEFTDFDDPASHLLEHKDKRGHNDRIEIQDLKGGNQNDKRR